MKKVLKILTLIMLILTIVKITDTFAKYFTSATATKEIEIGQWIIKLNDLDIYSENGAHVTLEIEPDDIETSEYTMAGKISPASTWYNDIILDPTGTDVAIKYDVEVDISHLSDMDITYQVSIADASKELVRTGENKYTGIIDLAQIGEEKKDSIRCSIIWANNESKNLEDTEIASTYGEQISIPVKITCTQYLGETITPYTP